MTNVNKKVEPTPAEKVLACLVALPVGIGIAALILLRVTKIL